MEASTSNTARNVVIIVAVLAVAFCACISCAVAGILSLGAATFATTATDSEPLRGIGREFFSPGGVSAHSTVTESFDVGQGGRLIVDMEVGEVRVEAATGDTITVEATVEARGSNDADAQANLDRVNLEITGKGGVVRVLTDADDPAGGWWGNAPEVNLRISVPARTSLELTSDVGEVWLQGTRGNVDVKSGVGRVVIENVIVDDRMSIQTNVASIEFDGALAADAAYDFRSDVGRIALRLPGDSRFTVEAESELGAVDIGFDVDGESTDTLLGNAVKGTVNGGGNTTVTARSEVGAVSIDPR